MTRRRDPVLLGKVVRALINYRGWGSPEAFGRGYGPGPAPLSGPTIRRVIDGSWEPSDEEDRSLKLMRLAGMLRIPPGTLIAVYESDVEGVARLEFDEPAVRQYVMDTMTAAPKRRRAAE
jgi:hypothetical protein